MDASRRRGAIKEKYRERIAREYYEFKVVVGSGKPAPSNDGRVRHPKARATTTVYPLKEERRLGVDRGAVRKCWRRDWRRAELLVDDERHGCGAGGRAGRGGHGDRVGARGSAGLHWRRRSGARATAAADE